MTKRHGLRDDQWERIESLWPGREGHVGVTAKDNRRVRFKVARGIMRRTFLLFAIGFPSAIGAREA